MTKRHVKTPKLNRKLSGRRKPRRTEVSLTAPDRILLSKLARSARGGLIDVTRASRALGWHRKTVAGRLGALVRRGWLSRVRRGLYLILPLESDPSKPMIVEDAWILANEVFKPCYIGGWTAAEHWGLTEQLFRSTLVVSAAQIRSSNITLSGHDFKLFKASMSRIRELATVWRGSERVPISDRERTLVDGLRRPAMCGGIRQIVEMMTEYGSSRERNFKGLAEAAASFGNGATWKRLGFLAELCWPKETELVQLARKNISAGYTKLAPDVAQRGRLVRRWGLWVNAHIRETKPR